MSKPHGKFVTVPFYVAENPYISPAAKTVYIALRTFYPRIHPTIKTVMAMTSLSRSSVQRSFKELEKWKLIKRFYSNVGGVTTYTMQEYSKKISTVDYIAFIKKTGGINSDLEPGQVY
jgi:CTP-dependent riboflavin kinase